MNAIIRKSLALAAAVCLAVAPALAGKVVLKDGRTLEGEVIVKDKVVTVNGATGLYQFKEDQVQSMDKGEPVAVQVAAKPTDAAKPAEGAKPAEAPKEKLPVVTIVTSMGSITAELFEDDAPNTVANFVSLAEKGFYSGCKFHRVIKDFMLQGGDPNSKEADVAKWGMGGPGYWFEDEFSSRTNEKYALSMANSGPNTNGSQFFIVTKEGGTPWLNGRHSVFGRVLKGQEVADAIEKVETGEADRPKKDVVIEKVVIDFKRDHKYEPKVHPGDK